MMDVCQKCGDKGDKKRLVHCIKCRFAAEHSYCFDTLTTNGHNKDIIWTCEECVPRDTNPILEPSIRSARISRAVEIKLNRIQMLRQMSFSTVHSQSTSKDADQLTNKTQPKRDSSCLSEEIDKLPKRRLVVQDDGSDEESQSVEFTVGDPPHLGHIINAYPLNMSNSDTKSYVRADPIWRYDKSPCFFVLVQLHNNAKDCCTTTFYTLAKFYSRLSSLNSITNKDIHVLF